MNTTEAYILMARAADRPCEVDEMNDDSEPVYRTKSGRILTDADIAALADEAERGYDVGALTPEQRELSAYDRQTLELLAEAGVDPGLLTRVESVGHNAQYWKTRALAGEAEVRRRLR